jgi:NAD(P)-dependent dehydrogenase (short-subunit alcohol dehydrogenase family)
MVNLTVARGLNTEFFKLHSCSALIVGGTAGIGQSIAFKIAEYAKKPQIVISGRDEIRGQETIAALKAINSEGAYSFEKCDITKLQDGENLAKKLSQDNKSFNLLVISSGFFSMKGRTETEDGIDEKLAVHFFGRFNLINRVMPLLASAANQGQRVNVLSVFAAGEGRVFHLDDIGLTKKFSLLAAASHASNCNDLMVEVMYNLMVSSCLT